MEGKKLYKVRTDYFSIMGTSETDVSIVKASTKQSACDKVAQLLQDNRFVEYVGRAYAVETYILEAD